MATHTTSQNHPSLRLYRPRQFHDLCRLGAANDGGYVLPISAVDSCRTLLSLGVEADWSFEEAVIAALPEVKVICVDGTTGPEVIRLRFKRDIARAAVRLRPYKFLEAWGLRNKPAAFQKFFAKHTFLRQMVGAIEQGDTVTLTSLMNRSDVLGPVLLKMDIEGSEYEVIATANGQFDQCSVIAIEFHSLDERWPEFQRAMAVLMQTHYIAHIHGNNYNRHIPGTKVPKTLEISLVHKKLYPTEPLVSERLYPIPGLDNPNKRRRAEIEIGFD